MYFNLAINSDYNLTPVLKKYMFAGQDDLLKLSIRIKNKID